MVRLEQKLLKEKESEMSGDVNKSRLFLKEAP